jgi:hypothetical protein
MDYDGIAVKYPVNRPLTDEERNKRVEVGVATSFAPLEVFYSIAQSEQCVEFVDKYYGWRGIISALLLPVFLYFGWQSLSLVLELTGPAPQNVKANEVWQWVATGALGAVGALAFAFALGWGLGKESFTHTHYPIRFNRKNRMVYVFRPKRRADILRVKWDDVYWHIRHNKNKQFGGYNWFVAGHVMDKDRKTVLETFAFGHVGSDANDVYPMWEYVRRFMQDGPNSVQAPELYLPINGRREGFWWGAQTVMLNTPANLLVALLMMPFTAPAAITRWLCMLSNRVPVWPADIEQECGLPNTHLRAPKIQAKPEYAKIVAFLLVGLAIDAVVLGWVFSISPLAK